MTAADDTNIKHPVTSSESNIESPTDRNGSAHGPVPAARQQRVPTGRLPRQADPVCLLEHNPQLPRHPTVYKAIDAFGELAAKAMMLPKPLTSCERLINNPQHTLYLMWEKADE